MEALAAYYFWESDSQIGIIIQGGSLKYIVYTLRQISCGLIYKNFCATCSVGSGSFLSGTMVFNRYSIIRVAVTVAAVLCCGEVSAEQLREGQVDFSVVTPGGIPQQETLDMSTAGTTPAVISESGENSKEARMIGDIYEVAGIIKVIMESVGKTKYIDQLPLAEVTRNEIKDQVNAKLGSDLVIGAVIGVVEDYYVNKISENYEVDHYQVRNAINTAKNLVTVNVRGQVTDSIVLVAQSLADTIDVAMNVLPPIEELTLEQRNDPHLKFMYALKDGGNSILAFNDWVIEGSGNVIYKLDELKLKLKRYKKPSLTLCGAEDDKLIKKAIAVSEGLQAFLDGSSFDSACQAHDSCYADCKSSKRDCDKKLLSDAEYICRNGRTKKILQLQSEKVCLWVAQQYYIKVDTYEDAEKAFSNAQANCPNSPLLSGAVPYTGVSTDSGLATALILDRSGSMSSYTSGPAGTVDRNIKKSKLDSAKEAAKSFILWRNGTDLISVSTFSGSGSTELDLSAVSSIKGQLDITFGKIKADGGTNIGAGLDKGFAQLNKAGSATIKGAILLSDGIGGNWQSAVKKYKEKGWPICTLGFGADANKEILQSIAEDTGCVYEYADTVNIVNKYQTLGTYVEGKSNVLSISDALAPQGKTSYPFYVSTPATMLDIFTSWLGSKLEIKLTAPDGRIIDKQVVVQGKGRYEEGDTFQMLRIEAPSPGKWTIESSWEIPPTAAEQINILIAEKSDVFGRIHGFRPQYSVGEAVAIKVDANEMLGLKKVPLSSTSISVQIQKPGPQMIRMVKAQSSNWTMYKDVVLDVTRDVELYDDGKHGDYKAGDGIFGGTYTETDKNGAYLVTARIKAKKQDGQSIEKTLISSFQVGKITQNQVTTSQTLQYREEANLHIDTSTPYSDELLQQPLDRIERMQNNPLDNIDKLLN